MVPAGSPARWRWSNHSDSLHVFLEPGLVARVATEAFGLDPACVAPAAGRPVPPATARRDAGGERRADGRAAGGRLAAESLANLLAVHLIRNASAPHPPDRRSYGALHRATLRAVIEYVEKHLGARLTLEEMAEASHLSPYHFARRFKAATGLPPHQYLIVRRVERAKQLLREDRDISLAEIAASRLLRSKPVLPALQARRWCYAGTIPHFSKNRIKKRKPFQEPRP